MKREYATIIKHVIERYKHSPVDILGIGDADGEYRYLLASEHSYTRTIRDIDTLFDSNKNSYKILEIGSFLGPVSIALKSMGYAVSATDIPEFYQSPSLRSLYEKHDIPFSATNLRKHQLPYESHSFDAVIICEVLEHLNFNPLPVLNEINRVLKNGGYIYLGMPNHSHIRNRMKLLVGKSIHNPIDDFFKQLDRNSNMVVGLHWREYTLSESIQMLTRMGFEISKKYYYAKKVKSSNVRTIIKAIVYIIPSFRQYQVVIGKKISEPDHDFWLTDANS